MKTSDQIHELAAALAKAQSAFETATRDHKARVETKTGGSYEFNYADFAAYLEVCRKPLGENGLSFIQEATCSGPEIAVTTRLFHSCGQWIETEPLKLPLIPDSRNVITAQIVGSGITYAKRYSLSSLIGLASESDDDGNTASGNTAETGKRETLPDCPKCGHNRAVIKGKAEYGGGFVCWKNKDGCGKQWQSGEASQPAPETNGTAPAKAPPLAQAGPEELTTKDNRIIAQCVKTFAETESTEEYLKFCELLAKPDSCLSKADNVDRVREQIKKAIAGHKHAPKKQSAEPDYVPDEAAA